MQVTRKTKLQYKLQHIIFIILLLSSIGFAGWLSNVYNQRSDWTAGKRHSLSNATTQLLKQLPFAINLRSYQADNPELSSAINEILSRYQNNKADFSFELINPDIFIERAKTDNIQRHGQTIIEYQGRVERIENISEEAISNALIRLQRNKKPQLLFLSQHGERNITDNSPIGYSQLANKLFLKGFDVSSVNLLQTSLSVDNSVLVLGSINKALVENEIIKLQQYIENGGQVLWLQDPGPQATQLSLLAQLDIQFIPGVVVDNNQEVSRMLQLSHPAMIPILEYQRHPITEKMQYFTLFTTAAAITQQHKEPSTESAWNKSRLLITSESSWSETANFILGVEFNKGEDITGPLTIGIAQHRQLELDNQKIKQRIVVIGDTDFISNNNLGHGANLDFILNTFNWLTKNDKLISIAPKNAPDLQLKLSALSASILGLGFLVALPVLFFISGALIWYRRHRK